MDLLEQARSIAATFNMQHGVNLLRVHVEPQPLTATEVGDWITQTWATRAPDASEWLTATEVFTRIRSRAPTHSEAISTGLLLKSAGLVARKYGPTTFYRLDKPSTPGAD